MKEKKRNHNNSTGKALYRLEATTNPWQ